MQDAQGLAVVEPLPPAARISLRARPEGRAGLGAALGLDLPGRVGDRAAGAGREALCLGPGEWCVTGAGADLGAMRAALSDRYAEIPHAAADISDRELSYRIAGPGMPALLAMGCPRDLSRIAPGRGARTIFHGASVVLWRDGEEELRLDIWRSFAPHVLALIETGLAELRAGL